MDNEELAKRLEASAYLLRLDNTTRVREAAFAMLREALLELYEEFGDTLERRR